MPNNPDPGELIAMVQHEPDEKFCNRCERLVSTRDGDDPTPLCDHCAHETVQELASALEQQVARNTELATLLRMLLDGVRAEETIARAKELVAALEKP